MWLGMCTGWPAPRHGGPQLVGIGFGALGPVRGFDRVNVEVDRADMVRCPGKNSLKRWDDRRALRVRLPAALPPIVPRAEVHHRLGVESSDLVVVGEALCL